jgi:hypothetical protein
MEEAAELADYLPLSFMFRGDGRSSHLADEAG